MLHSSADRQATGDVRFGRACEKTVDVGGVLEDCGRLKALESCGR